MPEEQPVMSQVKGRLAILNVGGTAAMACSSFLNRMLDLLLYGSEKHFGLRMASIYLLYQTHLDDISSRT